MSGLINLFTYGKHVALNISNIGSVTWFRDKHTINFHSKAIPLCAFRSMVDVIMISLAFSDGLVGGHTLALGGP